jgi:hypothetical protein
VLTLQRRSSNNELHSDGVKKIAGSASGTPSGWMRVVSRLRRLPMSGRGRGDLGRCKSREGAATRPTRADAFLRLSELSSHPPEIDAGSVPTLGLWLPL